MEYIGYGEGQQLSSPQFRRSQPRSTSPAAIRSPWRWLTRLNPMQSWLVVMGVIVGLSLLGLRLLALLVAVGWTGYAAYTWFSPAIRRRLGRARRTGRR